ncbi:MAG TPA: DNA internalization-related competence protein ComEC/Rec2 [Candidatus Eisenbacteria bacterium]|nr:DNA internalization-related competence protein ComEC/Rec2 [Candidatus Eisenbacteria bacterium]
MRGWRCPTGLGTALGLALGFVLAPACSWRLCLAIGGLALVALWTLDRVLALPGRATVAVLLLGAAAGGLRTETPRALPPFEDVRVAGRVLSWDPGPRGIVLRLSASRIDTHTLAEPRVVRVLAPASWGHLPQSSWLRVQGRLEPNRGRTVPGAWEDRDTAATLLVDERASPDWGPGNPSRLMRLRAWMVERIEARLRGFPARFAVAILLGRTRSLTEDERDLFRRTGTSHVIAVSGFHVTLVAGLATLCLSALPRAARILVAGAIAWGYAALAGWVAPALRAAAAALAVALGTALSRPRGAVTWMMLILPWLLWAAPDLLASVSFLLSLGAVAGILFLAEASQPLLTGKGRLLAPVVANVGAQWGTLPVIVSAFGTLSPCSLLPNLLAVPITGLLLPAVLFGLLAEWIGWHTNPFLDAAGALGSLLLSSLHATAGIPFITGLPLPSIWAASGPFVMMAVWFSIPRKLRATGRARALAWTAVCVSSAALALPGRTPEGPWVSFLDVGQGDAAVFRLSDGTVWVIDVGDDRGPGDAAQRSVLPFLRAMHVRAVDGLIISHRHRDHVGAMATFTASIPVRRVYDAGVGGKGGTSGGVDSVLAVHGLWPCLVATGDTLHASTTARIVVLHPSRTTSGMPANAENLNEASLVVRVTDGNMSILFAGDAESVAERACVANSPDARLLKVAHHGSDTSSLEDFLDAVHPECAVISVGEQNRFGHPSPRVLERLARNEIRVFTTATDGTVFLNWAGQEESMRTFPPRERLELD